VEPFPQFLRLDSALEWGRRFAFPQAGQCFYSFDGSKAEGIFLFGIVGATVVKEAQKRSLLAR